MNKMINRKQCTVLWHVDALKISHMEQSVIENLIAKLTMKNSGRPLPMKTDHHTGIATITLA